MLSTVFHSSNTALSTVTRYSATERTEHTDPESSYPTATGTGGDEESVAYTMKIRASGNREWCLDLGVISR